MFIRRMALAITLVVAPLSLASAQRVSLANESATSKTSTNAASETGRRALVQFKHAELPTVANDKVSARLAAVDGGGSHTIVISTLALVLGIILLVVLIM